MTVAVAVAVEGKVRWPSVHRPWPSLTVDHGAIVAVGTQTFSRYCRGDHGVIAAVGTQTFSRY